MMSINLSDIAILNMKDSDYCCIISLISKNEGTKLLKCWFDWKRWNIIKIGKDVLTFGNAEIEKKKISKDSYLLRDIDI